MHAATSESDITSDAPSASSPKPYYVESPSLHSKSNSNDETEKCSSTNSRSSPSDSPFYPSGASSSSSRVSGNRRRWNKHYCNVVDEERVGAPDNDNDDDEEWYDERLCHRAVLLVLFLGVVFFAAYLIVWAVGRSYNIRVDVEWLKVHNLYVGEGLDRTGVPTKLITINCSAHIVIYNSATFFGVQLSFPAANLLLSQLRIATAQVKRYYHPKKSWRAMRVALVGHSVPLYGTGALMEPSYNGHNGIPLTLELSMESRGYLVGKLVKTKHTIRVLCPLFIHFERRIDQFVFLHNSCMYI
ncbi:uncharacterized protein LOC127239959 [Andrographis paniculata]|uniref:uncharacterized protein LOC127239959 n=1 Tax=Andrographis paniculata TaxID=175694 RepID=UPI0021E6DA16|nr:uncharacterized protein LOC127239959 [Andrographis paniculata]